MQERIRRRAVGEAVLLGRHALSAVATLHRSIDLWQGRAAWLIAAAGAISARGGYEPRLVEEALALAHTIESQRQAFESAVLDLPPATARHGRIIDTRKALESVAQQVDRALALFNVEPHEVSAGRSENLDSNE